MQNEVKSDVMKEGRDENATKTDRERALELFKASRENVKKLPKHQK